MPRVAVRPGVVPRGTVGRVAIRVLVAAAVSWADWDRRAVAAWEVVATVALPGRLAGNKVGTTTVRTCNRASSVTVLAPT